MLVMSSNLILGKFKKEKNVGKCNQEKNKNIRSI